MADVDFSDFDSTVTWFETQSVETHCAVASRAALRVFANFRSGLSGSPDDLDMGLLRAILTSAGRGSGRPTDVDWDASARSAARSAALSADSARSAAHSALSADSARSAAHSALSADSALSAALSAASAARSARSAVSAALAHSAARSAVSAASWDATHLGDPLYSFSAWEGATPPASIVENHKAIIEQLGRDPAWSFWLRFYEGMWNGTFTEWDLAFEVIKIDRADWEKGYVHIGEVIAGIEAELFAAKTPLAERIYFDEGNGLFKRELAEPREAFSLEGVLSSVQDDLDAVLRGNCLNEGAYIVGVLRKTLTIYAGNPERVERDLMKCGKSINAQIAKGDWPDLPELEGLSESCLSGGLDIRAHHPDIASARANRALQAKHEATKAEKATLAEVIPAVRSIADDDLSSEIVDDLTEIIEGTAVTIDGGTEMTTDTVSSSGNRIARLWLLSKKIAKGGAIVGGGVGATAGAIVAIDAAIPVLQKAWPILARLLGF